MMKLTLMAILISGFGGPQNRILTSYYMDYIGFKPLSNFNKLVVKNTIAFIKSGKYFV